MTRADPRRNPVSTASADALDAAERALWRMMSFYGTPIGDLDAAITADPDWPLPRLMKAGFLLSLTEPSLVDEARALLAEAAALRPVVPREREHLVALQLLAAGDWAGAGRAWSTLIDAHPRDALALQWAHLFDFYRGDAAMLEARVAGALPAWDEDDPLHPHVLALHAFGLEETGSYEGAESTGRRALARDARVPWAIHAVAHVMEMQGRHREGARWLAEQRRHWGASSGAVGDDAKNGFAGHLGWHEALFALESLDSDSALAVFDAYLDPRQVEITLQRVDAASLLWRLTLLGVDVGARWRSLVAGWPLDAASAGGSVFNDAHALLALLGAGENERAREWLAQCREGALEAGGWNGMVWRDVGATLLDGFVAFAEDRPAAAFAALAPLHRRLAAIGGSHAQRDVVLQTLIAAAARSGERAAGQALLAERARGRAATPLGDRWRQALL